jgi:hypothetical protein
MVARWKERNLCSPTYIDRWQTILDAPPEQVATNILNIDPQWAAALYQNTPFVVEISCKTKAGAAVVAVGM